VAGGVRSLAGRAALPPQSSDSYLSWWRRIPDERLTRMLVSRDRADQVEPAEALAAAFEAMGPVRDEDAIAAMDLRWWIPDESNARVDHTAMYAAVEARAVFEDHDLVEATAGTRLSAKVGRVTWRKKAALVDAFQDLLPQEVRERPKWGWFSPVHYWVNEVLWDDLAEVVRSLPDTGLFTPAVRDVVEVERPTQDPLFVWTLAIFGLWYRWFQEKVVE
jgi:asparagine synthetase B (glutamine-hydrolysing)